MSGSVTRSGRVPAAAHDGVPLLSVRRLSRRVSNDDDPFADIDIPDDPTEDLDRAEQRLTIRMERRTYNKPVTVVEGFEGDGVDVGSLASDLKKSLGTGGTVEDDAIELQGDHQDRAADLLREKGYTVE